MKLQIMLLGVVAWCFISCSHRSDNNNIENQPIITGIENSMEMCHLMVEKGSYAPGEKVRLKAFTLTNSDSKSVKLHNLKVQIKRISEKATPVAASLTLSESREISGGAEIDISSMDLWDIPSDAQGCYGIYLSCDVVSPQSSNSKGGTSMASYKSFFRVTTEPQLNSFDIETSDYHGMPVYSLNRGLSAEYSIEKATANLKCGISHSWALPLTPVSSTPDFLSQSVRKTTAFYDNELGADTSFETVVISTGIPSAVYLASTMKAPLLPLHFLVGAETVKEVKTILDRANANGYSTYATLGHDYSISTTAGVAWIKLLDIPDEYLEFITRHKVKNIVFLGYSGGSAGEVQARKVHDLKEDFAPGSIYLMYFAGDQAPDYLRQTIRDYDETKQDPMTTVADWESGILPSQIDNFTSSIKAKTQVGDITMVTSDSDIALWDLGSYLSLAFMSKNRASYNSQTILKGVSMNPYLIGHPFYELRMGYIPFLFWQGLNSGYHIDNRLNTVVKSAVKTYFPQSNFEELNYWVNCTHNFGGEGKGVEMLSSLQFKGFNNVRGNKYAIPETWKPSDGMNSSSEIRAKELIDKYSADQLREWGQNTKALTPGDLIDISTHYAKIVVEKR